MGISAWLSRTEFTFLSHFGTTSGAPHSECLFFGDFHGFMMRVLGRQEWSILTTGEPGMDFP
jgi:hypothetical protein